MVMSPWTISGPETADPLALLVNLASSKGRNLHKTAISGMLTADPGHFTGSAAGDRA
jgi:hypothetical protein